MNSGNSPVAQWVAVAQVITAAWFPSLAQELPHTAGIAKEKKRGRIQRRASGKAWLTYSITWLGE